MTQNQKHDVGIFSRDGGTNYKWLIVLLHLTMFNSVVGKVNPIYISNDGRSFITGISQNSFAIVYHTKKRGRLNIANVTDSLYDEELKELSDHLGRSNVVVLVDDVEDSSDSNMRRISEEQRLDSYACKLILISEREKESANLIGPDPRFSDSPISAQMHDAYNSLYHKMLTLKDIIKNAPHRNAARRDSTSSESSYGSRREGHAPSVVTSTGGFRSPDDSSVRSSQRPGSDMRNDEEKNLLDMNSHRNATDSLPIPQDNNKEQGPKNWKKDKVLWIIGGLITLLVVVLIIVLSVTL